MPGERTLALVLSATDKFVNEASLRASTLALFRKKHPEAVVFRHEDLFRAGVPDTSISYHRLTSWWEFKYGHPTIHWRGAQAAEMRRLWSCGIPAYYVIFLEKDHQRWTLIVPATANYRELKTDHYAQNFSYQTVVEFIDQVHTGGIRS